MYTFPNEIDAEATSIGTSTLFAAWNEAIYVAQIEDERLAEVMGNDNYLKPHAKCCANMVDCGSGTSPS